MCGWSGSNSRSERSGRSRRFWASPRKKSSWWPTISASRSVGQHARRSSRRDAASCQSSVDPRPDRRGVGLLALVRHPASTGTRMPLEPRPRRRGRCSSGGGTRPAPRPSAAAVSSAVEFTGQVDDVGVEPNESIDGTVVADRWCRDRPLIGLPWASTPAVMSRTLRPDHRGMRADSIADLDRRPRSPTSIEGQLARQTVFLPVFFAT